ncbi:hypothetical protein JTE90_024453 [Oedothorax gibbosus]|uniref:BTB domain-containing protein n=1 Tax=Oedothorax gibbosus TaxID=931172 RepID=A0AAV6UAH8_9ARAC|nr:hypothetical protein JTE90_024453 [Oedothorax gibbosus]
MAHRDIMHTSNPGYEYSFCWTIDDFHKMPSFVVQGPAFSPIPGCSDQFCFQVEFRPGQRIPPTFVIYVAPTTPNTNVYSNFYLRLLDLTSNVHHRTVHGTVTLQNTKGTLCDITFNDRIIIEKFTELMTYDICNDINSDEVDAMIILSLSGLADGKLTLHGSLRFTGFLVTSSIYSISVPKPSEELGELANDFKSLYESGSGSDVTFTVGDQVLPAHKLVLGARSEVFAKMFEHRMLESNTNNVIIDDIDPDAFNKFLLFLYTGALEGSDDCESHLDLDVYAVAHRYQVKSLQKMCVGLLGNSLTSDSLCESLVLADLCNDEEFKGMVKFLLRKNFFDVVSTAKWAEIVTTKPELAKEITDYMKPVQN